MSRVKYLLGVVAVWLLLSRPATAAVIVVGDHDLQPNMPGQTIQLFVSGGDAVQGLNFNAQIADGGPEAGGTISGPHITAADILTGTIFAANNTGQDDPGSFPQLAIRSTTTSSGTVSANGLLATLTIDTTGFTTAQTWALNLGNTLNGPTDFAGVPATITDGTISVVVPEPSAMALAVLGTALVLRRQR